MFVEIGGLIKKGLGHSVIEKFSKLNSVMTVGIANGRASDLFDIQEFGDSSESEILTMIVDEKNSSKIFDDLYKHLDLENKKQGVIFQLAPVVKGSF